MVDPTPFPPPPAGAAARPSTRTAPTWLQHPWALLATAVGLAAIVSVVIGTGIGVAAAASSNSSCTPADGWCKLGGVLVGFAVGVGTGAIAYITTAVAVIARFRPKGSRAGFVVAVLAIPPAVLVALSLLSALTNTR